MRNVAVTVALLATVGLAVGCSNSDPSETATLPLSVTITPTDSEATTPTVDLEPPSVSDADAQGFLIFGGGARCTGTDNAEFFLRTEKSALVVCRSEINRLYYRGYRISDGASIVLYDVSRQYGGYVAVNAPDDARYVITADGFQLVQNGIVVLDEAAVEVGPDSRSGDATSPIVLGSASSLGPAALGYGSEQPSVISMGSCANAISEIVWQDWGGPIAHGNGLGCTQLGQPPEYPLMASDMGMCEGELAYRTLQIGTNGPQDICSW